MKKLLTALFLFTLLFGFGSTAQAKEKIGFVNMDIVSENYAPFRAINEECLRSREEKASELEKKKDRMTAEEKRDREAEIDKNFRKERNDKLGTAFPSLWNIIAEVGKQKGVQRIYILPKNRNGYVDLTKDVLKMLNKQNFIK